MHEGVESASFISNEELITCAIPIPLLIISQTLSLGPTALPLPFYPPVTITLPIILNLSPSVFPSWTPSLHHHCLLQFTTILLPN